MTNKNQHNAETVKWMCVLAYILFFMPLVVIPNSEDGKFHANQGLTLLSAGLVVEITGKIISFIPFIGFLGSLISWLGFIAYIVMVVIGIMNAINMQQKKLPLIGEFTFLR